MAWIFGREEREALGQLACRGFRSSKGARGKDHKGLVAEERLIECALRGDFVFDDPARRGSLVAWGGCVHNGGVVDNGAFGPEYSQIRPGSCECRLAALLARLAMCALVPFGDGFPTVVAAVRLEVARLD